MVESERRARTARLPPTAQEVMYAQLRENLANEDAPHGRIRAARRYEGQRRARRSSG
jgi:hypothetical protein